jgi:nucleolar GTP-binding protein
LCSLNFQVENILNRLHVAQPVPRDNKIRAPCIPANVLKKKLQAALKIERTKKLEREIEEEMGDDYVLDLKKNYDIEGEQKYDVIPEFWEGHNVADYIDLDIFEVKQTPRRVITLMVLQQFIIILLFTLICRN